MSTQTAKIGDILRQMDVLTIVDITRILLEQKRSNKPFGQIAVEWGLATPEQIDEAWARQLASEQRHIDLDRFGADERAIALLTSKQARHHRVLPLRCWGSHMVVALVAVSLDGQVLEDIAEATGCRHVYPCYCSRDQLERYLDHYYPVDSAQVA